MLTFFHCVLLFGVGLSVTGWSSIDCSGWMIPWCGGGRRVLWSGGCWVVRGWVVLVLVLLLLTLSGAIVVADFAQTVLLLLLLTSRGWCCLWAFLIACLLGL